MNLIEVMLATVLFSCSAGSCLQLWGLLSLDAQRQQQRQQLAERLEGELVSLDAHLRQQPRQAQLLPPCGLGSEPLRSLLAAQPAAAGVQRQIRGLGLEEGLLVELSIEGSSLRRQRLYRAAALGLCLPAGPAAAAAAPQAAPASTAQPLPVGGGDGLS